MKILQINKYPSIKGGTETILFKTIDLLKKQGNEVVLFSTDEGNVSYSPTYTVSYSTTYDSLLTRIKALLSFFYNKNAQKQLENLIESEKPDIAHVHLYLNGLSQSILPVLKRYNIPVVMTLHEYRQICPSYLLMDRKGLICEKCKDRNYLHCMLTCCSKGSLLNSSLLTLEMFYRRWFYKTEKYIDRFICVSHFIQKKHHEFNRAIFDKSQVIYNSVSRSEKQKDVRGNYILYFGRFSKEKGIDTLLNVASQLPNVSFKLVGEKVLSASKNVEFIEFVGGDVLKNLIRNAMYVVIPSNWYETFGMSCVESLSLGVPVIASRIGALPELIEHGKNGFLFDPKDEVQLLFTIEYALKLSDSNYWAMSEDAVKSIEYFSDERYISELTNLYNELLNSK